MKRKSCELCKHPYTFAPVYREGMPEQMPLTVVFFAVVKHLLGQAMWAVRMVMVSSLWLVAVPWLTTQSLHYYGMLGPLTETDSPAWHPFLLDCLVGFAVTGATFLLFLSLMLLRELLLAERDQERVRNELQWRDDAAVEEAPEDGDWHAGVPPREYRAWLRRRQLWRERQALEEGRRQREEEDSRRTSIFSNPEEDDAQSLRSSASTANTMRLRRTSATVPVSSGSPASGRTVRVAQAIESLRCRHCNSRFCISREHLLLTRLPEVRRLLPATPPPDPDQPLRLGEDDWPALFAIGINVNPDPDQAEITFARLLGLSTPASPLLTVQSVALLLMANWLLLHTAIIIPMLLGALPLKQMALQFALQHEKMLLYKALAVLPSLQSSLISRLTQGYAVMFVCGALLVRWMPSSSWISRWLRFTGAMAKALFFLVGHELLLAPLVVGRMMVSHNLLVTWSVGMAALMLVGQSIFSLRQCLRSGLFYWMRHPNDLANHPLRVVVIKPVSFLLRRMVKSLVLQVGIMTLVIGTGRLAWSLTGMGAIQEAVAWSEMMAWPSGLLCSLIAARLGHWLASQIGHDFKAVFLGGLRILSRSLRLSSVLFGGRWPQEEAFPRSGQWQWSPSEDRRFERSELLRAASMPVEPLDVARSTSRLSGFTVTFRPYFYHGRWCLVALYSLASLMAAHLLGWCLPLFVGRSLNVMKGSDAVALIVGCSLLCGVLKTIRLIAQQPLNRLAWILFKGPVALLQLTLFLSFPLVVWPCLTGLYVYSLISPLLSRWDQTPIIAPISAWAIGLPIVKLAWSLRQHWVRADRNALLDVLVEGSPWQLPFWSVCRMLLWPVTAKLGGLLLIPPLVAILVSPLLGLNSSEMLLLQRCSHSLVLLLPLTALLMTLMMHLHKTLVTRIREDTYLIDRRLVNLGEELELRPIVNNLEEIK